MAWLLNAIPLHRNYSTLVWIVLIEAAPMLAADR
jgi:hypothetical protein